MVTVRDFIPPLVFSYGKALIRKQPEKAIAYPSYEEALKACRTHGYSNEKIIDMVEMKTRVGREAIQAETAILADFQVTRALLVLSTVLKDKRKTENQPIKVVDIGGACGMHYFTVQKFFHSPIEWIVVETPAMVSRATKSFANNGIRFVTDLNEAKKECGKIDLVFSSSCLQYMPDPLDALKAIIDCGIDYIYLSRIPISRDTDGAVFIQRSRLSDNGPGKAPIGLADEEVEYPITILPLEKIESILGTRYEVLIRFNESERFRIGPADFESYGCLAWKK